MTRRSILDMSVAVVMGYAGAHDGKSPSPAVPLAVHTDQDIAESTVNRLLDYQAQRDFYETAGRLNEWLANHPLAPDHTDLVRFAAVEVSLNGPYRRADDL
jgi:hypothetical protein